MRSTNRLSWKLVTIILSHSDFCIGPSLVITCSSWDHLALAKKSHQELREKEKCLKIPTYNSIQSMQTLSYRKDFLLASLIPHHSGKHPGIQVQLVANSDAKGKLAQDSVHVCKWSNGEQSRVCQDIKPSSNRREVRSPVQSHQINSQPLHKNQHPFKSNLWYLWCLLWTFSQWRVTKSTYSPYLVQSSQSAVNPVTKQTQH